MKYSFAEFDILRWYVWELAKLVFYTLLVCVFKIEESGRKFEQSFNTELSRFLDNVWDTGECSVKNSAQHCHKLSAAGGRDLAAIPQIVAGGLNVQNLLRSNSACNLYCQLLYLTQYK